MTSQPTVTHVYVGATTDLYRVTFPDGYTVTVDALLEGDPRAYGPGRTIADVIREAEYIRDHQESEPDDPTINPATGYHYYGSPQWNAYDEYGLMDEEERLYQGYR